MDIFIKFTVNHICSFFINNYIEKVNENSNKFIGTILMNFNTEMEKISKDLPSMISCDYYRLNLDLKNW